MTITKTENNGSITLSLDGWLDTISAPALGEEIAGIGSASEIIIDFDKVEYIASSGLRQIVAANMKAKALGAGFSVINAGAEIMSIFKMTGLDKKISVSAK